MADSLLANRGFDGADMRVRFHTWWNHGYGTFRHNFHRFDRFELDLRGHTQPQGAALSCLRLKWADMVLI